MARQSGNATKKKANARNTAQGRKAAPAQGARRVEMRADDAAHIIDARTRRDITGVVFILLAVVLMLCAALPTEGDGVVTTAIASGVHMVFGVGCYVLPFVLAAVGVTFLVRFERERVPLRVAIGLGIIFVALLGLIALFTPVTGLNGDNLELLFSQAALVSHGGYIGAGIAWAGLMLFGQVISCVILVGVIVIGVIIIGFSISKLIEKIRAKKAEHAAAASAAEGEGDVVAAPPFARVRRARARGLDGGAEGRAGAAAGSPAEAALSGAETGVLVKPATTLASSPTSVLKPSERASRGNRRHRASQPAADAAAQVAGGGDAAAQPTTRLVPLSAATGATDAQWAEGADRAPVALTRKLGKKHADADAKPSLRAKAASRSSASPVATPHPQEGFELPPMSLLASAGKGAGRGKASESELSETAARLQETLEDFGIMAQVVGWVAGPTVTLFKVDLPAGVRVSRVTALNDDIALALAAPGVRIFAPIPGTNYVGIEVPNRTRQTVLLSDVLTDAGPGPLQIAIGKDVEGHSIVSDLAKMPHLLIGGTTGSGKSVSINAMIMSILMRATPAEVRFIMIDPKRVEFTPYNGIPHLYVPVVTEAKEAASALSWGVAEMERRLKVFSKVGARNIGQFNAKVQAAKAEAERVREAGGEPEHWGYDDELPYIVIIIDELADLMMNVGKEVEFSISRIAQLARAAGIHLIVATQRPSTNVVTGLIKANITNRIAFNVASGIDSRVILDTPGAENLIGLGDLLLSKPELSKPQRIQGCYVSEDEINAVVSMLKAQGEPEYHSEILSTNIVTLGASSPSGDGGSESDDPLLWDAADIVVSSGLGSTSNIQRRLKVGYARAGRIMDQLEEKGVVGPANGSKPREVLLDDPMELETLKAFEAHDED